MNTFGERLKQKRQELGFSQAKLAKLAGMTQGAVAQIEVGRNQNTSKLIELAHALNVAPEWLLHGSDYKTVKNDSIIKFEDSIYYPILNSPIAINSELLSKHKISTNNLFTYRQQDHSMSPTIKNGAFVFIDTSKNKPVENEIFLISRGRTNILRRIAINSNQQIIYRCDNLDKIQFGDIFPMDTDIIIGWVYANITFNLPT